MRDLDQSSRITIPASGFWKCRIKRPDRRAHSIPSSYGKFSSCIAGGNHRREICFAPEPPRGRSGLIAKRHQCAPRMNAGYEECCWLVAGRPGRAVHGAASSKKRPPCRSKSVGLWPSASHGRGTATKVQARVPAARFSKLRTRRSAPAWRAGPSAAILTGPLNLKQRERTRSDDCMFVRQSRIGDGIR